MAPRNKGVVIPISSTDDTGRVFASVNEKVAQLQARVRQLSADGGAAGNALAAGMHGAVPEVAAASAAVRALDGTFSVRAVERFLTSTLKLGPALQAAFPVIGAVAFASVIAETIEKLYTLRQAGIDAPKAIDKAFDTFLSKLQLTNAELDLSNAKLQQEIDKLDGKHGDGLVVALNEAKVASDRLKQSLNESLEALEKLLKENSVGLASSFLSGQLGTGGLEKSVLAGDEGLRKRTSGIESGFQEQLTAAGADPKKIAEAHRARLAAYDQAYGERINQINQQAQGFRDANRKALEDAASQTGDFGSGGFQENNYTANIKDAEQASAAYQDLLKHIHATDTGDKLQATVNTKRDDKANADDGKKAVDAERKAEAERRAKAEAEEKAAAAARTLADAETRALAARQKAGTDTELDQLESAHRALLVADEDYYRKREEIQSRAIANQRAALASERNGITGQIAGATASGAGLTGNDKLNNESKIVELRAKLVDLDIKDAQLTGEAAKNTRIRADAETDLARKRLAAADQIAAQLESERGGSVTARQTQSRDEFRQRRAAAGSDPDVLANLDTQQGIDQDSITAKGAEQDFGAGDTQRRVQRAGIDDAVRRGTLTAQDAQRQKIALDKQEAEAMQPLLVAYQALAADGDLGAAGKVAELQQKIAELKDPVNEVAAEIRNQFDSAFEGFFENIARGRDALKSLGDAIAKDATKDLYQQFIRPQVQSLGGLLIPNRVGNPALPGGDEASAAPASMAKSLGSILAGFPGLGGLAGKGKDGDKQVTIKIENKADTPVSAETASGSFDGESYVVGIVLKNLSEGGSLAKAFGIG